MTVSLYALALVLGCAVAFSLTDLLRKLLAAEVRAVPLLFALAAGMVPCFVVWWGWQGVPPPAAAYWLPGTGSVVLNIVANLAFLQAVRISPLSLTIPVLSLTPVFTTLLAVPLLGELPTPLQLAGTLVVVAGVAGLQLGAAPAGVSGGVAGRASGGSLGRLVGALLHEKGSLLMVVTALCWSLAMPLDKLAMASGGAAFHGLALNLGVAVGALVVIVGQRRLGELGAMLAHWRLLTVTVVIGAIALVLILLAIVETWVGLVETLKRGVGSLLSLVWGRMFFAEPLSAGRLVAVAAIGAGVAMILL